jgi:hypothetical protein
MAASEAIRGLEAKTEFDRALVRLRLDPASRPLFEALAALTGCPDVEDYLWRKLRGTDASGAWRICATPETWFLRSFERRLKRLFAEEAAFARGALYVPPTIDSLMADCDPLAGAEVLVDDFWVVVKSRDGTKHYPRFGVICAVRPASSASTMSTLPRLSPATLVAAKPVVATKKARRGGGKRGPSYKFGDKITADILKWAAENKGASPLPQLKRLWAEENKGVKTPPSDMTHRRFLKKLRL